MPKTTAPSPATTTPPPTEITNEPPAPTNPHQTRSRSKPTLHANCIISSTVYDQAATPLIVAFSAPSSPDDAITLAEWTLHYANVVIDPATGASLEYQQLLRGVHAPKWIHGTATEIGLLAQGHQPHTTSGSETLFFIPHYDKPSDRIATFLRIVAALRPHKAESKRTRFTMGGDRIQYNGNVSTPTADLTTVKLLINSVISTPGARYMTIDIKDFYLGTLMSPIRVRPHPGKIHPSQHHGTIQICPPRPQRPCHG
jgi:hypothetical protein